MDALVVFAVSSSPNLHCGEVISKHPLSSVVDHSNNKIKSRHPNSLLKLMDLHTISSSRGGVLPRTGLQVRLPSLTFSASTPSEQAIHTQVIQGSRAPSHILVLADSHGILHHRRQWCSLLRSEPRDPCPATPPTDLGARSRHCVVTKFLANQAGK
ncbi:uncharacterized protein LY79DRAFT_70132 [Colletotrichum navitas]|uniref:Uncharacterized protein n=1 Tax=Colletotrichum navitas TaxID=681940 RepID=A0AAD8PL48_9PEZI|nr:uncharacterized protein LY79DRAFT_70132 [Colletotrichum navitas]KAK1569759.1 hypothetical protein LY79DRAFT_70132 [Colletotrichum navitas]